MATGTTQNAQKKNQNNKNTGREELPVFLLCIDTETYIQSGSPSIHSIINGIGIWL